MAADLFPVDTVYELAYDTNAIFGYGLASKGGTELYHLQRWILFSRDKKNQWPPRRACVLRRATDPGWKNLTKSEFIEKVRNVFNPAQDFYVLANCRQDKGAHMPDPLPRPQHLIAVPGGSQPDVGLLEITRPPSATMVLGYANTFFESTNKSYEYWVLNKQYDPALESRLDNIQAAQSFSTLMQNVTWDENSTLITCACAYLSELPPVSQM
ncbi:MAG: hypothetical protein U0271_23305 [Polyangiaceae bacterium]